TAAFLNSFAADFGKVRVIHTGGGIGAEILIGNPLFLQVRLDGFFQFVAAMIGSQRDGFVKSHWLVPPVVFLSRRVPALPGSAGDNPAAVQPAVRMLHFPTGLWQPAPLRRHAAPAAQTGIRLPPAPVPKHCNT